MSKPQNPYVDDLQITGACLEQGWNEGFAAGIKWAKEAARIKMVMDPDYRWQDVPVINWTEVDK